jgi:Flp pilus assembly protein TadD
VWNTLGVAYYYAGEWAAAIEALEKSEALAPDRQFAHNGFPLAMAHWRLGDQEQARTWYCQAVAWMEKERPMDETLVRFRAETEELLGIKATQKQ